MPLTTNVVEDWIRGSKDSSLLAAARRARRLRICTGVGFLDNVFVVAIQSPATGNILEFSDPSASAASYNRSNNFASVPDLGRGTYWN